MLTAELSHRVKNTLAVVSSIAERTLPDGAVKSDLLGRFYALGHTHDLLAETGWTEARLRDVIRTELAPHAAGDGSNLTLNGPPVMLKPQAALFLALVMHELATNAAKYGALSVPGGRIDVTWKIAGDPPPHLELTWAEYGGPKIDGPMKPGFGTELIERGLRFELGGESKLEAVDGRLQCHMIIPGAARLYFSPRVAGKGGNSLVTSGLDGLRILVVEDEYLVASLIQDFLEMAGCVVLGPIARLAEAVDAAHSDSCDAAVLDVNLGGRLIFPVAEILSHRRIPFAFVTGYATGSLPGEHHTRPTIRKPFRKEELLTLVSDLVNSAA